MVCVKDNLFQSITDNLNLLNNVDHEVLHEIIDEPIKTMAKFIQSFIETNIDSIRKTHKEFVKPELTFSNDKDCFEIFIDYIIKLTNITFKKDKTKDENICELFESRTSVLNKLLKQLIDVDEKILNKYDEDIQVDNGETNDDVLYRICVITCRRLYNEYDNIYNDYYSDYCLPPACLYYMQTQSEEKAQDNNKVKQQSKEIHVEKVQRKNVLTIKFNNQSAKKKEVKEQEENKDEEQVKEQDENKDEKQVKEQVNETDEKKDEAQDEKKVKEQDENKVKEQDEKQVNEQVKETVKEQVKETVKETEENKDEEQVKKQAKKQVEERAKERAKKVEERVKERAKIVEEQANKLVEYYENTKKLLNEISEIVSHKYSYDECNKILTEKYNSNLNDVKPMCEFIYNKAYSYTEQYGTYTWAITQRFSEYDRFGWTIFNYNKAYSYIEQYTNYTNYTKAIAKGFFECRELYIKLIENIYQAYQCYNDEDFKYILKCMQIDVDAFTVDDFMYTGRWDKKDEYFLNSTECQQIDILKYTDQKIWLTFLNKPILMMMKYLKNYLNENISVIQKKYKYFRMPFIELQDDESIIGNFCILIGSFIGYRIIRTCSSYGNIYEEYIQRAVTFTGITKLLISQLDENVYSKYIDMNNYQDEYRDILYYLCIAVCLYLCGDIKESYDDYYGYDREHKKFTSGQAPIYCMYTYNGDRYEVKCEKLYTINQEVARKTTRKHAPEQMYGYDSLIKNIENLKKKIQEKDIEITTLKEENYKKIQEKDIEITTLKEENDKLKMDLNKANDELAGLNKILTEKINSLDTIMTEDTQCEKSKQDLEQGFRTCLEHGVKICEIKQQVIDCYEYINKYKMYISIDPIKIKRVIELISKVEPESKWYIELIEQIKTNLSENKNIQYLKKQLNFMNDFEDDLFDSILSFVNDSADIADYVIDNIKHLDQDGREKELVKYVSNLEKALKNFTSLKEKYEEIVNKTTNESETMLNKYRAENIELLSNKNSTEAENKTLKAEIEKLKKDAHVSKSENEALKAEIEKLKKELYISKLEKTSLENGMTVDELELYQFVQDINNILRNNADKNEAHAKSRNFIFEKLKINEGMIDKQGDVINTCLNQISIVAYLKDNNKYNIIRDLISIVYLLIGKPGCIDKTITNKLTEDDKSKYNSEMTQIDIIKSMTNAEDKFTPEMIAILRNLANIICKAETLLPYISDIKNSQSMGLSIMKDILSHKLEKSFKGKCLTIDEDDNIRHNK